MTKPVEEVDVWVPGVEPFVSALAANDAVSVLSILSDRLYNGLKWEASLFPLIEGNWQSILEEVDPAFLLVESVLFSNLHDWRHALSHTPSDEFLTLIARAKAASIPTVFWFTSDAQYWEIFQNAAALFDFVFVSDPRLLERVSGLGGQSGYLAPAFQPRIHNPLKPLGEKKGEIAPIVISGGKNLDGNSGLKTALSGLSELNITCFERTHTPPVNYFSNYHGDLPSVQFQGRVSHRMQAEVIKYACMAISSPWGKVTETELRWQAVENAAAFCETVFYDPDGKMPFEADHVFRFQDEETFREHLTAGQERALAVEQERLRAWRENFRENTYRHRFHSICDAIGLGLTDEGAPKVSIITPTMRPGHTEQILANFHCQTYPNKELVIVVNGERDYFDRLQSRFLDHPDISVCFMPSDYFASSALNLAAKHCRGEYIFRFDDDDFYGETYLEDMMRYCEIEDFAIIGKFGSFVNFEDDPTVYVRRMTNPGRVHRFYMAADLSNKRGHPSGATFGMRKQLIEEIGFPDTSLSSADTAFLERLRKRAPDARMVLSDNFNYTIFRKKSAEEHTWKVTQESLNRERKIVPEIIQEVPRGWGHHGAE
ncbi:glycosyltransferase family 2 protein [Sneathiella chinensis]|nr:glycosyltransferase family 2 protein [Sneathiella chinensis]